MGQSKSRWSSRGVCQNKGGRISGGGGNTKRNENSRRVMKKATGNPCGGGGQHKGYNFFGD